MNWVFEKKRQRVGPTWSSLVDMISRDGNARNGLNRIARRRVEEVVQHYRQRGFPQGATLRAGLGALRSSGATRTPFGSVVEREILGRLRSLSTSPR